MSVALSEKEHRNAANRERMGGLHLAEEAIAFLRLHGRGALIVYGLGTIPFVLLLVLFTGLMLHGLYAHLYLVEATFILTVLFFTMKWAQYRYTQSLYAKLLGDETNTEARPPRWRFRAFAYQGVTHTLGLLALPLCVLLLMPIPWYVGFMNTVMALDNDRYPSLRALWTAVYNNLQIWTRQNFMLFWLLSPLAPILIVVPLYTLMPVLIAIDDYVVYTFLVIYLVMGGLGIFFIAPIASIVFVNIVTGLLLAMTLLVAFSGVETREYFFILILSDTTFWLFCVGLCYLVMDPVLKCAYVLRVYHVQSLKTGDDLRTALLRIRREQSKPAPALVADTADTPTAGATSPLGTARNLGFSLLLIAAAAVGIAAPAAANDAEAVVIPTDALETSLQETLSQQRYAWRMPRDFERTGFENPFYAGLRTMVEYLGKVYRYVVDFMDELMERLARQFPGASSEHREMAWYVELGLRILIGIVFVILAWILYRAIRKYLQESKRVTVEMPTLAHVLPDIHAEDVHAGDLPEEDWLGMARDLARRGDYRPAVRAVYLGMLAYLARRELLRLARYKSNAEYRRELQRRLRAETSAIQAFQSGIHTVEAVWYGGHKAEESEYQRMLALYKEVTAYG